MENVGLRYDGGPEVLSDLSFGIEPRSFQYLTGPSGAGKTSMLKLMSLAMRPTRGVVSAFGKNTARASARDIPALRLLDHLTTFENVALPLRVQGKEESSYGADVRELLGWVGLGERMYAMPPVLSGGEKQRAAIARAVIGQPDLLLADEPTGNVDPQLGRRLLRLFVELNKLGTSIVIATHDVLLMQQHQARRFVLHDGQVQIYD
jgi:cell division transport system ATP-binding protein